MSHETKTFIPTKKVSELTRLHPNTVRSFAEKNIFQYYRTPSGQRRYNKECILKYVNNIDGNEKETDHKRENYLYARVSSKKQSDDLERQINFLRNNKQEYFNYTLVTDISSGINFKRKGLQTILESILQGTVGTIVVAHKDRLARFGFDLIQKLVELQGGKITIINNERNKSSEQELAEDLLSIIHIFSCREMGKRKYRQ